MWVLMLHRKFIQQCGLWYGLAEYFFRIGWSLGYLSFKYANHLLQLWYQYLAMLADNDWDWLFLIKRKINIWLMLVEGIIMASSSKTEIGYQLKTIRWEHIYCELKVFGAHDFQTRLDVNNTVKLTLSAHNWLVGPWGSYINIDVAIQPVAMVNNEISLVTTSIGKK